MKKLLLAVFGIALICGLSTSSFAANTSLTFPITVHVVSDPIDLQGVTDAVAFGAVAPGVPSLSNYPQGQPRSTVAQMGYATIALRVHAAVTSPGVAWTLGETPGATNAVLAGVFTAPLLPGETSPSNPDFERSLVDADFGVSGAFSDNDIIMGLPQVKTASATVFSREGGEQPQFQGFNITPATNTRNLRYRLVAPTAGSPDEQTINVTIEGVQ